MANLKYFIPSKLIIHYKNNSSTLIFPTKCNKIDMNIQHTSGRSRQSSFSLEIVNSVQVKPRELFNNNNKRN